MSLDLTVYCQEISETLIPKIVKRLNDFDMAVEIHPGFKFDEQADTGFLPFKFRFKNPKHVDLKDKDLLSGFEIYFSNFDLAAAKEEMKPKPGFFNIILGKKKEEEVFFSSPEIENKLKLCKKSVSFVWHVGDTFEFRFASLTSAILTEITDGVRHYAADDIWYDNHNIVENAFKEFDEYERSLTDQEIVIHEFEGW
ncbi:MAG: hypothetical protein K0R51_3213 [Cytophagaceae bacterium]|jgi:hypothetical protein|nr:hypothetical protein [Cytophagaceae bacterium]